MFFAVKTWSQNHKDRVPVIQNTWAKDTKYIRYYSDVAGKVSYCLCHITDNFEKFITTVQKIRFKATFSQNPLFLTGKNLKQTDATIPTISTNVENTEHGHCAKTIAILQMIWEEIVTNKQLNQIKYVVLTDDDTLLR